ncbi:PTS transporter subunit EIIC, partial [Vibrio sp. FNV 38]|nr:PTS transporter subunit EIIC [Vibrio sp. FNV 38]
MCEALLKHLEEEKPARDFPFTEDDKDILADGGLLTVKPVIYAANLDEQGMSNAENNPNVTALKAYAEGSGAAVLPVAALLLRFGQPDLLNVAFIAQAGGAIFDNLALIFAIGVASSWSKDSAGAAALAGAVGYFVLTKAMVTINPEINMGVLAGIITGLVGGAAYNRWSDIELPDFLSFFGGKRFVPIATGFFCLVLAAILGYVWSPVQ